MHPQGRRPQAANMCMHPREAAPQRTYIYVRIYRVCTRGRRPHSEHICPQGRRPPGEHSARAHARALRLGSGESDTTYIYIPTYAYTRIRCQLNFPSCTRKGGGPKRRTCACCRGRRPRSEHTSTRTMHPQGRRPQAANMCMHPREAAPQRTYIYVRIYRVCTRGRRPHSEHICPQGRRPPGEHSARAHARALRLGSGESFPSASYTTQNKYRCT